MLAAQISALAELCRRISARFGQIGHDRVLCEVDIEEVGVQTCLHYSGYYRNRVYIPFGVVSSRKNMFSTVKRS
jgi:hypothetical protein